MAHQIERLIVVHIRTIATDPQLVAATLEEARRQAGSGYRISATNLRNALAELHTLWTGMTAQEQAEVAPSLIDWNRLR